MYEGLFFKNIYLYLFLGVGPNEAETILSSSRYLYGIATGGLQAPNSKNNKVNYTNLWNSGTLDFIDIDEKAGNMKGIIYVDKTTRL